MDRPSPLAVADDEARSRLRFFTAVAWLQLLGAVYTVWELQRFGAPSEVQRAKLAILLCAVAVAVLCLWQARRGRIGLAAFAMPLTLLAYVTYSAWEGYGIHDVVMLGFPLVLSAAGLLLGPRGPVTFGALSVAAVALLWWGEAGGLIVTPWSPLLKGVSLLSAFVLLGLNAVLLTLLLGDLSASLRRSQEHARALGASEARLRSLVQDAPVTILGISREGTIEFANLEPVPAAPLLGRSVYELFAGRHREAAEAAIRRTLDGGAMTSFEAEMGTGEGDRWWYSIHVGPLRVEDRIRGATLLCVDVSEVRQSRLEREAAMAELAQRNDELQRFTYAVSHDLRSPLVTVKGFLGAVEAAAARGETGRVREDVARIRAAADRMDRLLRELLELSRVGRLANAPEDVPFAELVGEARAVVSGRLEQRGARLQVAADLPTVRGDRRRLAEVLQNLVDNAVKFMGDQPEPRIEVGARRDGDETVFFVRDNGIGIEPRHQERVFGLFERLDPAIEGTGVGLALVKRIVEVHGGRIWIESEGAGRGTTFCFTLAPPARPEGA